MAVDLNWASFVGSKTIEDGGYVGDLLTIASAHIDNAVTTNRLTTQQAGEIYTAMIPSAFQNALKFGLEEYMVEAQITDVEANIALKEAQLAHERDKTEAELEQQWGYNVTRDVDNSIVLGSLNGTGKIDKEKVVLDEQAQTADKQQSLLDSQYDKSEHEIDLLAQKKIGRNQ